MFRCRQPEILKDRDLAGELKDVWSAVQNFRDKEKAGVSDIVVYTEFGPDTASESIVKPVCRNESSNEAPIESESQDPKNRESQSESSNCTTNDDRNADEEVQKDEKCATESLSIDIDNLLLDKKKEESITNQSENNEKIVKIHNQKNKESSQHHFFPKFLSSSKDKEAKEKEKEDQEPKSKTKKSLNFFRRSKSSFSSPTHTSNNNLVSSNQKSDSNLEH